jgi:glycosyltransferase involved in cell wall biosynthesis
MSKSLPFMSIVVISYNGETVIGRALQSLLAQDYPKDRYEIIVVDDGSTDRTGEIVKRFAVRYHRKPNGGVADARTAGLRLARGDVYVCFDDDCYVDSDWLSHLAQGYSTDNPLGVAGRMIAAGRSRSLASRYMEASNIEPANRARTVWLERMPLVGRFVDYVLSNRKSLRESIAADKAVAQELYGANGSYDMRVLREIGGWDDDFSGIEDRALCRTLALRYPDRSLYVMKQARIYHEPDLTLGQYLLRPYKRGVYNARFHLTHHIFPPIFPFPCVYAAIVLLGLRWNLTADLSLIVFTPLFLYGWWLRYAIHVKSFMPLLFAYIQMAEETMVIAGLIRGYLLLTRGQYARR